MGNTSQNQECKVEDRKQFFNICKKLSSTRISQPSKTHIFDNFVFEDSVQKNNRWYIYDKDGDQNGNLGIMYIPTLLYYQGNLKDDEPNGQGLIIWCEKDKQIQKWPCYRGTFSQGKASEDGTYTSNSLQFTGKWNNGLPYSGILKVKNQEIIIHTYKIEKLSVDLYNPQALSTADITMPDKSIYSGQIRKLENNFCFHGQGKMTFSNGDTYNGEWQKGLMHGMGRYEWKSTGNVYQGMYKYGMKDGEGSIKYNDNIWVKGIWKNGKKI